jgi:hypothetical protein
MASHARPMATADRIVLPYTAIYRHTAILPYCHTFTYKHSDVADRTALPHCHMAVGGWRSGRMASIRTSTATTRNTRCGAASYWIPVSPCSISSNTSSSGRRRRRARPSLKSSSRPRSVHAGHRTEGNPHRRHPWIARSASTGKSKCCSSRASILCAVRRVPR